MQPNATDSGNHEAIRNIKTSVSHRGYSLIRASYTFFAFLFLYLFSVDSWHQFDLTSWGFLSFVGVLAVAHIWLLWLSSDRAAVFLKFLFNGRPPACYLTWVTLELQGEATDRTGAAVFRSVETQGESGLDSSGNGVSVPVAGEAGNHHEGVGFAESSASHSSPVGGTQPAEPEQAKLAFISNLYAIKFGLRRLLVSYIDRVELTLWGNLIIQTKALSGGGDEKHSLSEVMKLPFGAISGSDQRDFINMLRKVRPDVVLNRRLEKRMQPPVVKGEVLIQTLGPVFLCLVLLDLNFSILYYLEILKDFHQAQIAARYPEHNSTPAKKYFDKGEQLRLHPSPISYVERHLLDSGAAAVSIMLSRAEALWYMGQKKEAISSLEKAIEFYPTSLYLRTELCRWKFLAGDKNGARTALYETVSSHSGSLIPKLYMLTFLKQQGENARAHRLCDAYCEQLDLDLFENEPWWPPGSNRRIHDMWSREDVLFILRRGFFDSNAK